MRAHGVGILGRDCGSSQKSFRLVGLYRAVRSFEGLNAGKTVREARI